MKKVMILVSAIVLTASAATAAYVGSQKSSALFEANVEALTEGESVGDYIQDILGCRGGEKKCFEGTITIKGVSVSGIWFKS